MITDNMSQDNSNIDHEHNTGAGGGGGTGAGIRLNLDVMMAKRRIGTGELSARIGITQANLSILKNDKAKAMRFSTLAALCRELECQPGDLMEFIPDPNN